MKLKLIEISLKWNLLITEYWEWVEAELSLEISSSKTPFTYIFFNFSLLETSSVAADDDTLPFGSFSSGI